MNINSHLTRLFRVWYNREGAESDPYEHDVSLKLRQSNMAGRGTFSQDLLQSNVEVIAQCITLL